jgi:hypothetical protein
MKPEIKKEKGRTIVVIPKKMSNSGSIYDIASDNYDIEINMTNYEYVLVYPSFYNKYPDRCSHKGIAVLKYKKNKSYEGIRVLDKEGNDVTDEIEHLALY